MIRTTLAKRGSARMRRASSMPEAPGRFQSRMATSGTAVSSATQPSSALRASRTLKPAGFKARTRRARYSALSSTTRAARSVMGGRNGEGELAAAPGRAVDPDASAVRLDDRARDVKAQARPVVLASQPRELAEELGLVGLGDAGTCVPD